MTGLRTCVFGTSNGLFKDGYVAGITDVVGAQNCANFSVGASSSFIWFATRHLADFRAYNFAVLDYCVNDGIMIKGRVNTTDNWRNAMGAAIAELRAADCQPVMLILPSLQTMRSTNPLRPVALALAADYGVPFLDGFALMERVLSSDPALQIEHLFRDPAHLHPAISRTLGAMLAAAIGRMASPAAGADDTATGPLAFRMRDVTEWVPEALHVERATSLVKRRFVMMRDGDTLACPAAAGERLVGVALDLAKSNGTMAVMGDNAWHKSWTNMYHRQWLGVERAMVFSVLPVMGGISAGADGFLRITVQADDKALPPNEAWGPLNGADAEPASLCLAGLLFEHAAAPHPIRRPFATAPDLLTLMPEDAARHVAASVPPPPP